MKHLVKHPFLKTAIAGASLLVITHQAYAITYEYTGDTTQLITLPIGTSGAQGVAPVDGLGNLLGSNNTITVDFNDATVPTFPSFAMGGFDYNTTGGTKTNNNTLNIRRGTILSETYGGYAYTYTTATTAASGNTVNITGGNVNIVSGGLAKAYTNTNIDSTSTLVSSQNTVIIDTNTYINGGVSGGQTSIIDTFNNTTINSETSDNKIDISGGSTINGLVSAGKIDTAHGNSSDIYGTATNNTVTINGGQVNNAVVGVDIQGMTANIASNIATHNTVTLHDVTVSGYVIGANVNSTADNHAYSEASYNTVIIGGNSNINRQVVGGNAYATNLATTTNNTVIINDNSYLNYNLAGATVSTHGDAISTHNTVIINGGYFNAGVLGSEAILNPSSSIGNNSITLTNNRITIQGTPTFGSNSYLYGGSMPLYSGTPTIYDFFTDNSLDFSARPISVSAVGNFEKYTFTIDPVDANTGTVLITANDITFGANATNISNGSTTPSSIEVVGVHPGQALAAGDTFKLMQATSTMNGNAQGLTSTGVAQQGISLLYDIQTNVDLTNKEVTATILGTTDATQTPAKVNPQTRALAEGRLAGVSLMLDGANLVSGGLLNSMLYNLQDSYKTPTPFIAMDASHNRYNSGSHIDSDNVNIAAGTGYCGNGYDVGVFVQGGWGSYDSYNSFSNAASIHGQGNTKYYGAGVIGHYDLPHQLYVEGSLRAGKVQTDFHAKDLVSTTGVEARYDVKSNYVGAHIGIGYIFDWDENNSVDLSLKYLWNRQSGNSVEVAGDPIRFEAVESKRMRAMARWNHAYNSRLNLTAGLGYEYEFDGKANATTYHVYNITAPSLKGSTGLLELGAQFKPQVGLKGVSFEIKAQGYVGQREGVGALAVVKYAF